MKTNCVIISGLGISGLITASLFSKEKLHIECFEPRDVIELKKDERTTAFLNPSIGIFKEIGVWEKLEPFAQPLKKMEIIDASNSKNGNVTKVVFEPKEVGEEIFGYNISNKIVSSILLDWLRKKKNFVLNNGDSIIDHYAYDNSILVKSKQGKFVEGKLLISCEGKDSAIRNREKISVFKTFYNQSAMVFQVTHSFKHENKTTEILDKGGPFTIIPLRISTDQVNSTVVWMDSSDEINRAYELNNSEFNTIIAKKSLGMRGKIKISSERQKWPVCAQITKNLVSKRMVLIAESAHVMPPTGAQGLNTSIEDIITLYKICENAIKCNRDIGTYEVLRQYNVQRFLPTGSKVFSMHLLNKISMTEIEFLKKARKRFMRLLDKSSILKRSMIKIGLGKQFL